MCHISFSNLQSDKLNQQMYMIMSMLGSSTQKHGWGYVAAGNNETFKCELPAYLTSNVGNLLNKAKGPIIGHVRMASAGVPITPANAHPFSDNGVFQVHNGTLTPKDESKFVMKEDMETITDIKENTIKIESVKRSDSLIFFERFMQIYGEKQEEFVPSLVETMKEFTGKFAFIYHIEKSGETFVVRGRTADLHISYLLSSKKKDAKKIGYVINTNKEILETCTTLLSNMNQLETGHELVFTAPLDLDKEAIFLAEKTDIKRVGEIKEEYATASRVNHIIHIPGESYKDEWGLEDERYDYYNSKRQQGDDYWKNINKVNDKPVNHAPELSKKYAENIDSFMRDYCVSMREIQLMLYVLYGVSMEELDDVMAKHFCGRVLETMRRSAVKQVRKELKKIGSLPTKLYREFEFPWMLNPKNVQIQILNEVRKFNKVA